MWPLPWIQQYDLQKVNVVIASDPELDPDSIRSLDPVWIKNPDPDPGGRKLPPKKVKKCQVLKCWMFLLWADGFS